MILAFDTSGNACSVAIANANSDILAAISRDIGRGHAEALMPMIDEALSAADTHMQDISKLAVTTGPGSFTGVRVGVAAARGLALALDCPLVGLTALEALAFQFGCTEKLPTGTNITSLIDARRGQAYAQTFEFCGRSQRPRALSAAEALSLELAKEVYGTQTHLAGQGALINDGQGSADVDAGALARLGLLVAAGDEVRPFYLRAPDAVPSKGLK